MKLSYFFCISSLSFVIMSDTHAESCNSFTPGQYDTPTGTRIRGENASVLNQLRITKYVERFSDPIKCWNMSVLSTGYGEVNGARSHGFKDFNLTGSELCLEIKDYGVGSFDPLKRDYCKHNSYVLQLHDESPRIFRVYKYSTKGKDKLNIEIVGEFSKSGEKVLPTLNVPGTAASQSPEQSPTLQVPGLPNTTSDSNQVGDLVKRGLGDFLKGIGK